MTEDSKYRTVLAEGYPPPRHLLRDLLMSVELRGKRRSTVRAPVVPEICTDRGGVYVGVVATLVDVLGGGLAIRSIYPDWIATSDLSVYMTGQATSGTIMASGTVVRAGRTTVVIEVDIFQEAGNPASPATSIGSAVMTFSRLPRRKGTMEIKEEAPQPFLDEVGIRIVDSAAGAVEMNASDYVLNSFRVLQGGMIALLTDLAGQQAAGAAMGASMMTRDIRIHYLAQGKVGPFRTRARVIRTTSGEALTRVEVIDTGANNRLLSIGMNSAALDESVP
jgi:uncharacterized protein (TIGR00369 family)